MDGWMDGFSGQKLILLGFVGVLHLQVPNVQLPHLIPESQHLSGRQPETITCLHPSQKPDQSKSDPGDAYLLPEVHGEAHVPDVTLAVVKATEDGHVRLVGLNAVNIVLHLPWLPAHNGVLTRLVRGSEGMKRSEKQERGSEKQPEYPVQSCRQ